MRVVGLALCVAAIPLFSRTAAADCEQVCYPGLPCQGTEISGEQRIAGDLCAGDLVLTDGARLILQAGVNHLINVERSLKVIGTAEIVTESCLAEGRTIAKAASPKYANPYNRGPETDGPGDAKGGKSGPAGGNGENGVNGAKGLGASFVRLAFADFSGGILKICAKGGRGSNGQGGGDGADGGDGEQGGRAIPGQPLGCESGPGHGGNGGKGGNAGNGGNAGDGGDGGDVTLSVPTASEGKIKSMLSKEIIVDVSSGSPGEKGKAGKLGKGGRFGYGGRGAKGCKGRVEERKGQDGEDGQAASDGREGLAGAVGKLVVKSGS